MKKKIILLLTLLNFAATVYPAALENMTQNELNETLISAAWFDDDTLLKKLINLKADVNCSRISDGLTPLIMSAQNGYLTIVKSLINAQADVNTTKQNGATPLFKASKGGHVPVVEYLVKNGAIVDLAKKNCETTPLNIAAYYGHTAVVKCLIAARANLNKADFEGTIPVHEAVKQKHTDTVAILIRAHKSQHIAPLYTAIKTIHAIEQAQACTTQNQPTETQQAACYALDGDEKSAVASLPSIIEKFPVECLHIIMQKIPLSSLAHFRQSSKRCCVATQYEYTRRLKNRIGMLEALLDDILKRAKKQKKNHAIVKLLEQVPRDLWQAALDA